MQIEGPNSSSNPLVDRRLNERGVHDKSPTDNRQMHPNAAEISSRSLGEIVVSLHSDLAMELPKYPGFTAREQGAAPTADLLPQQQSSEMGSDRIQLRALQKGRAWVGPLQRERLKRHVQQINPPLRQTRNQTATREGKLLMR